MLLWHYRTTRLFFFLFYFSSTSAVVVSDHNLCPANQSVSLSERVAEVKVPSVRPCVRLRVRASGFDVVSKPHCFRSAANTKQQNTHRLTNSESHDPSFQGRTSCICCCSQAKRGKNAVQRQPSGNKRCKNGISHPSCWSGLEICLLLLWCPGSNQSANGFKDGRRSQMRADLTFIAGRTQQLYFRLFAGVPVNLSHWFHFIFSYFLLDSHPESPAFVCFSLRDLTDAVDTGWQSTRDVRMLKTSVWGQGCCR